MPDATTYTHPFIISDLDGTLSDPGHRLHYIRTPGQPKDWDSFFRASVSDPPVFPVIKVLQAMCAQGYKIKIWTGRSEDVRESTEKWLLNNHAPYNELKMRPSGNRLHDLDLKRAWVAALSAPPLFVLEDRDSMVKFWRDLSIPCFQVAPGDF